MTTIRMRNPHMTWALWEDPEPEAGEPRFVGVIVMNGGHEGESVALFGDSAYLRGVGLEIVNLADNMEKAEEAGVLPPELGSLGKVHDDELSSDTFSPGEIGDEVAEFLRKHNESGQ